MRFLFAILFFSCFANALPSSGLTYGQAWVELHAGAAMTRAAWPSGTYIVLRPHGGKVVLPFLDKVVGGVASLYQPTVCPKHSVSCVSDISATDWAVVSPTPTPPAASGTGMPAFPFPPQRPFHPAPQPKPVPASPPVMPAKPVSPAQPAVPSSLAK